MKMQTLSNKASDFFYEMFNRESHVYKKLIRVSNYTFGTLTLIGVTVEFIYHLFII